MSKLGKELKDRQTVEKILIDTVGIPKKDIVSIDVLNVDGVTKACIELERPVSYKNTSNVAKAYYELHQTGDGKTEVLFNEFANGGWHCLEDWKVCDTLDDAYYEMGCLWDCEVTGVKDGCVVAEEGELVPVFEKEFEDGSKIQILKRKTDKTAEE